MTAPSNEPVIFALDPGSEVSAWVRMQDGKLLSFAIEDNEDLINRIPDELGGDIMVLEFTKAFAMPIRTQAKSGMMFFPTQVLDTAVVVGRLWEAFRNGDQDAQVQLLSRRDVKHHLCGGSQAKDAQIREAMLDRFGGSKAKAVGLKKTPGPLYGVSKDVWAALAVGVTYRDKFLVSPF